MYSLRREVKWKNTIKIHKKCTYNGRIKEGTIAKRDEITEDKV